MAAVEYAHKHDQEVPPVEESQDIETFEFLRTTARGMRRGMRHAKPTPREGIEAGLDLMLAAIEQRLAA